MLGCSEAFVCPSKVVYGVLVGGLSAAIGSEGTTVCAVNQSIAPCHQTVEGASLCAKTGLLFESQYLSHPVDFCLLDPSALGLWYAGVRTGAVDPVLDEEGGCPIDELDLPDPTEVFS